MRLGIFGGSFDPVHYGHLLLAETCREECALDQVWFVPAATPPHKVTHSISPAGQRQQMLELAVGGSENLVVSDVEIKRGGVSYTVDTLTAIAAEQPEAELFLLLGSDSLNDLPNWRQPERVCQLAAPLVVRRPGSGQPDYEALAPLVSAERLQQFRQLQVEMPLIELSSTDIRRRVAEGKSIRYRTPRAVEKFIETSGLYRQA